METSSTAAISIILQHPDNEEIISKLMTGIDPKDVADWLKLKYPNKEQSELRVSVKLLTDFVKSDYTSAYKQVEKDLFAIKNGEKIDKKLANSLVNNKSYQERLSEIVEEKLELLNRFKALDMILRTRVEQIFDKIQQNPENVNGKTDYVLLKYIEQYINLIEKYDKHVNNKPDQVIQHNHTLMYIDQYTACIQDAVRETLAEIDQETAMLFLEKIADKMQKLSPPNTEPISEKQILSEVNVLHNNLLTMKD